MKMSLRSKVVIYALLVMVAIYFLSPFVYMLFSTLRPSPIRRVCSRRNGNGRTMRKHGMRSRSASTCLTR